MVAHGADLTEVKVKISTYRMCLKRFFTLLTVTKKIFLFHCTFINCNKGIWVCLKKLLNIVKIYIFNYCLNISCFVSYTLIFLSARVKWYFCMCHQYLKLMKGKALRKQSLHEKTAASVLLKLFISGNEWCHTTDAP